MAVITKYHKLSCINNRHSLSHILEDAGMRSGRQQVVPARACASRVCSRRLSWVCGPPSLCAFTSSSLCAHLCIQISPSYKDTHPVGLAPTLMTLELDYLSKDPIQIRPHSEVLGVRTPTFGFCGDAVQPVTAISLHFSVPAAYLGAS